MKFDFHNTHHTKKKSFPTHRIRHEDPHREREEREREREIVDPSDINVKDLSFCFVNSNCEMDFIKENPNVAVAVRESFGTHNSNGHMYKYLYIQ